MPKTARRPPRRRDKAISTDPRPWWRRALPGLLLVAVTLVAYAPALSAGFIWDDPDYVVDNATLRSLDGLRQIWLVPRALPQYYPMVHTTFWVEFQLWGLWAPGYHAVNVLLHATAAVLLWVLLRRLDVPGAWLAAAVFAVHPVHVESVAWITERKNVLSLVFYLAAFLAYLRGAGFGVRGSGTEREDADAHQGPGLQPRVGVWFRDRWYWVAMALFVAALLSKTVTCSLPAAILLVLWWKNGRLSWRRDVAPLVPLFVVGAGFALWTAWLERAHVGAQGAEWAFSVADRFLIAGRAVWFYLCKLLVPLHLAFIYPRWTIDDTAAWQYAFPVAAAALVVVLFLLRNRIGRGPLVAVLFFGGTLLPALGFVNVYPMRYSFVADHFQYHASLGLIALFAAAVARLVKRPAVVAAVVVPVLVILTMRQATIYHDVETLWRDTVAKNPDSWMVRVNLADALMRRGDPEAAFAEYRKALELAPHLPETHWNVGVGLAQRGDLDAAMAEYDEALRLADGRLPQAHFSRGNVLLGRGQLADAEAAYREAIAQNPGYAEAHFNLGVLLEQQGRLDEAIEHYERAVAGRIDYVEAHYNLANALRARGRRDEALVHYSQVLRIDPRRADAHTNLGATLFELGRYDQAARAFRAALSIDPTLVPAQRGLAASLQRLGR